MKTEILQRIESREAVVGIIGLGYVGLPLLLEFAKAGFPVVGFDIDAQKTDALSQGRSYIRHISPDSIKSAFSKSSTVATTDFSRIRSCDAILICVPTPLDQHQEPDLSFIESTARTMAPHIRPGQLISLESTTYPGTTEEVLAGILDAGSGLTAGNDYFLAYSPEREDPNNSSYSTSTIPKVVGGINPDALEVAQALYNSVICTTIPVSSCSAAEATKLMENIFRCVNIALVNELKVVFTRMGIDIWEVVEAAKTKPFGFMPFYPGPGLGGHCIPIDPFYLTWKAKEFGVTTRFIELAGEINTSMPEYVLQRTMLALNEHQKSLKGSKILLVGLAYKKNVDDDRESPTYVLWQMLEEKGAQVDFYDPFIPKVRPSREHSQYAGIPSQSWEAIEKNDYDAAIISTAHDDVPHERLHEFIPVVIDTRGAARGCPGTFQA